MSVPMAPGLIWGFQFEPGGGACSEWSRLDLSGIDGFRWLHLGLADQWSRHWIEEGAGLSPAARSILLGRDAYQSVVVENGLLCCALQDFERDFEPGEMQRVGPLNFVLGADFIITTRHHPIHTPDRVRARLAEGARVDNAAAALALLIGALLAIQSEAVRDLEMTIQSAEDALMEEGTSPDARAMLAVRRRIVLVHRLLQGMRTLFQRIEQDEDLPAPLQAPVERIAQQIAGLDADAVAAQAQLRLIRDEIDLQTTQRTNQNLYVISILTTLLLPATFVTGLFGMNTGGMPLAGSPWGTAAAGAVALLSAGAIWLGLRITGIARR